MVEFTKRERIVQESVPGKQLTLAHIIAHPDDDLYVRLELVSHEGAIGILRITPNMAAIIAADVAAKAAGVEVAIIDRFSGSVVIIGDVAAVEAAFQDVENVMCGGMGFAPAKLTKT